MQNIFIKWLINTIAIMLAIRLVPGITYDGSWYGILIVSIIFGFVNIFIKPFIQLFTLPLLILSLGLFTFVINAIMLNITGWVSEQLNLGFHIQGFKASFWGAIIISVVSMVISCIMPSEKT